MDMVACFCRYSETKKNQYIMLNMWERGGRENDGDEGN